MLLLVLILDLLAIRAEKKAWVFPQLFCSGQRGSGAAVFSITSTSTISNFGIWVNTFVTISNLRDLCVKLGR